MASIGERKIGTERPGSGWLECIGLSLRRDEFARLFEEIGDRYGAVDEHHFNLPSEPYTYIYAGAGAEDIPETKPAPRFGERVLGPAATGLLTTEAPAPAGDHRTARPHRPAKLSPTPPETVASEEVK